VYELARNKLPYCKFIKSLLKMTRMMEEFLTAQPMEM